MFVIRPVREQDIPTLTSFAKSTSLGMISMPRKEELLRKKMESAVRSFESPQEESMYLFVLEDLQTKKLAGCCGVYAKTGVEHPLYFFRTEITTDPTPMHLLHPIKYHNGPSELCALYMSKEYRSLHLGPLLSFSRFLFIAKFPERFEENIMARLRGVIDTQDDSSRFWDALGRKFIDLSLTDVMRRLEEGTRFIDPYFPKYPIYAELLPKGAQSMIGKTHPTTRPALRMLKKEGFVVTDEIDIIDGGPTAIAKQNEIRVIRDCQVKPLIGIENLTTGFDYLISNDRLNYRCTVGKMDVLQTGVKLSQEVATALEVKEGDPVRYVQLRQRRSS